MNTYQPNLDHHPLVLLSNQWGWVALRGVFALIFGVLALTRPGLTLSVLVIFWGAYALIDGVIALVAGFRMGDNGKPLWSLIFIGLLGIGAGVVTFFWPGVTALTLILIIGAWAIAIGIFQIVAAVRLRRYIRGEWLHALSGVLSIVFGLAVVWRPGAGAIALAWLIGWFAILFGVLLIAMAFRLRNARHA